MLPNLLREERYLLLPSDLGAFRVFVEALRLSDGIMVVFMVLTLADRARDDLVGVVAALGSVVECVGFAGVGGAVSFSRPLPRERGRTVDVSSSALFFARLPGAVFSSRPLSAMDFRFLVDVVLGSGFLGSGSSRPALELLRFSVVAFACSLFFHVDA